jgi:hypothetical protein
MISHILLIVFLIYVGKRLMELLILIWQWLSRQINPAPEEPPSGQGDGAAGTDHVSAESSPQLPGYYAINHDLRRGSQRSELVVAATPEVLPEVFLDLLEKLGGQMVLTLGENLPGENAGHIISFTPPMDARKLQAHLAEYADILNRLHAIEVTVHNTEKCCYLMLQADKSIVLEACNAAPYVAALQRRGLREVQTGHFDAIRAHTATREESENPEERLAQLKQRLEISSSYVSMPSWAN